MPDPSPRYVPNRPQVAHECFEDEVILIHFTTGKYYRLDAPGRVAWSRLERGADIGHLAEAFGERFDAAPDAHRAAAQSLVQSLLAESLIVEDDGRRPPLDPSSVAPPLPPLSGPRASLVPARLEVFTDLADLLLLDPIHDTDESGWPHAKA